MGKEDKYSASEFWQWYYPEDMSDVESETGMKESHDATDDFVNEQESSNPNKNTATDNH